jgi:hypothetical protein
MQLSELAIQQFNNQFTIAYQSSGKLGAGRTSLVYRGLTGDAFKMPIQGGGVLPLRGSYQSPLPIITLPYDQAIITFLEYGGVLPVDKAETQLLLADVPGTLATSNGMMLARCEDQTLINTLNNATLTNPTIGDGTAVLTVDNLKEAAATLDANNVPSEGRTLITSSRQVMNLLGQDLTSSSLFVNTKNMDTGTLSRFLGFDIIGIPNMQEGGLPLDGTVRTSFLYHRNAVGMGYVQDPVIDLWFEKMQNSFVCSALMTLGAAVSLTPGVIKFLSLES